MSARIGPGFGELVHHFDAPGQSGDIITAIGVSADDLVDIVKQDEYVAIAAELMGNLNSSITMTTIDFVIGQDGPDDVVVSKVAGHPGLSGGAMTPINNSFLLQKRTVDPGRRGRGRMYLPGVSEGSVENDGTLGTGVAAGLATNVEDWLLGWPADWLPVLLHQVAPFTPSPGLVINVSPRIATQRTRLRD